MTLQLYGHPFSSYTWKALVPFHAYDLPFEFRMLDQDQPENYAFVQAASPQGKFPVLVDGSTTIFEATSVIEYLALHHLPEAGLIPADPDAALEVRTMDRVFDNYVMNQMQVSVNEAIRNPDDPDPAILEEVGQKLDRTYAWLESWLGGYEQPDHVTLIECAAAPSLFYADWVQQISDEFPRLKAWRAHLLAIPAVSRCVEDARPWRHYFPLGAPDRD